LYVEEPTTKPTQLGFECDFVLKEPAMTDPIPGRYRHYKGNEYEVLGIAHHSETEEELVVYRALYGEFGLWVRPRAMFLETVEVEGVVKPRFERVL
jgi:hypothetical protein